MVFNDLHPGARRSFSRFEPARKLILLLSVGIVLSVCKINAQPSLLLLPPDLTEYPVISTGFYPFDQSGRRVSGLSLADLELLENDQPVPIDLLDCPEESAPAPVSVILGIDVSNSMEVVQNNRTLLSWVEEAARTFINDLPLNPSEVGTIAFSDRPRQLYPMSVNRSALLSSVTGLDADGGTDFDRAFLDPAGGIGSAAVGRQRKVLILFTDGEGVEGDREEIIRRANGADVSVYIVALGAYAMPMLKDIAERTGGLYIHAYQRPERLNQIARMFLAHARRVDPCELRWRATPGCNDYRRVVLRVPRLGLWGEASYTVPESVGRDLILSKRGIRFGQVAPGTDSSISLQLRARSDDLTIIGYSSTLPNVSIPVFDLPGSLPRVIKLDSSLTVNVTHRSTGTDLAGGMIIIATDACIPDTLFVSTGLESQYGQIPSIVLQTPNGGEVYPIGSTQRYEFEGGLSGNDYHLRTSTDAGVTWSLSGSSPLEGGVDVMLPGATSDSCLAEVWQDLFLDETVRLSHPADLVDHVFTGDSTTIASLANDGVVRWFDIESGLLLDSIAVTGSPVRLTAVGGRRAVVVETTTEVLLLDPVTRSTSRIAISLPVLDPSVRSVATLGLQDSRIASHRDLPILYGVRFVRDSATTVSPLLYRHSIADDTTTTLDTLTCFPRAIDLSDGGRYLAFGGAGRCLEIRRNGFDAPGLELSDPFGDVIALQFDQSGEYLAVLSHDPIARGYSLTIRRVATGGIIFSYPTISSLATSLDFETMGGGVILGERVPTIRDILSGGVQKSLARGVPGNGRARSHWARPLLATTTGDSALLLWRLDQPYRHYDRSDSLWRLVAPEVRLTPVDFGGRLVGEPVDSLLSGLVVNEGGDVVLIDSLRVSGKDADDFEIITPIGPFSIAPGDAHDLLLRFLPSRGGNRSARLIAYTGSVTFESSLTGLGLLPGIELRGLVNRGLDFGSVTIGISVDDSFIIANVGDRTLRIDSITTSGPNDSEFVIDERAILGVLDVGEEIEAPASFTPAKRGLRYSRYLLHFSDTLSPESPTGSPAPFLLYGTGVTRPDQPAISYLPPDTARSKCLEPVFDTLTLLNSGTVPLDIGEPFLRDGLAFGLSPGTYPIILNVGESHDIYVAFRPTDATTVTDQLVIPSSADTIELDLIGISTGDLAELTGELRASDAGCSGDSLFAELIVRDLSGKSGEATATISIATPGVSLGIPSNQIVRYEPGEEIVLLIPMIAPGIDRVEGRVQIEHHGCGPLINLPILVERLTTDLGINQVDTICSGESVELSISGEGSVVWDSDPIINCSDCPSQNVLPRISRWVFGVLTDERGCSRRDSVWMEVLEPATGHLLLPHDVSGSAGDTITLPLTISVDRPLTGVNGGVLTIEFDGTSLQPIIAGEDLFSETLLDGWSIEKMEREEGSIRLLLSGPEISLRSGLLARIVGTLYLGQQRTTPVSALFEPFGDCVELDPGTSLLTLDSICGLDHRLIEIGLRPMRLHAVVPNPSDGAEITVRIDLPFDRHLRVGIVDVQGRTVATIVDGMLESGAHSITFETEGYPEGTYMVHLESEGWNASQRFLIAR